MNLYLILNLEDVKSSWFDVLVGSEDSVRRSVDGSKVVLKIPEGVSDLSQVPEEYKADWAEHENNMLTHSEVKAIMSTEEWYIEGP